MQTSHIMGGRTVKVEIHFNYFWINFRLITFNIIFLLKVHYQNITKTQVLTIELWVNLWVNLRLADHALNMMSKTMSPYQIELVYELVYETRSSDKQICFISDLVWTEYISWPPLVVKQILQTIDWLWHLIIWNLLQNNLTIHYTIIVTLI